MKVTKDLAAFGKERCFTPWPTTALGFGLDFRRGKSSSPPVPTPYLDPGKLIFQRTNDSQGQAFPSPHYKDVDDRPVYGPSGFDLPKQFREGLFQHPHPRALKQGKYRQLVKDQEVLPLSIFPTNFAPTGSQVRTTPQGCGWDRRSSGRIQVDERHLSKHLVADLHSCHFHVPCNGLLHSLYVRMAGHKNCDMVSESGAPSPDTTN